MEVIISIKRRNSLCDLTSKAVFILRNLTLRTEDNLKRYSLNEWLKQIKGNIVVNAYMSKTVIQEVIDDKDGVFKARQVW